MNAREIGRVPSLLGQVHSLPDPRHGTRMTSPKPVRIGVVDGLVTICIGLEAAVLDAEGCRLFARLWAQAEQQAETGGAP